jgi:lysophospholipase L1-like esterase
MPNKPHFLLPQSPVTWVMAGDSITQGVLHTYGARCWVEHFHERVRWQMRRFFDVVINSGMSGWTAPEVLSHYEPLIGRHSPDVVHIALGTNDCLAGPQGLAEFSAAMTELVQRSQHRQAQVVLHTPTLVTESGLSRRAHQALYAQALRELALRHGTALVDHAAHWRAHFGENDPIAWMDDPAHPNAVGHTQMARLTLSALGLGELEQVHQP